MRILALFVASILFLGCGGETAPEPTSVEKPRARRLAVFPDTPTVIHLADDTADGTEHAGVWQADAADLFVTSDQITGLRFRIDEVPETLVYARLVVPASGQTARAWDATLAVRAVAGDAAPFAEVPPSMATRTEAVTWPLPETWGDPWTAVPNPQDRNPPECSPLYRASPDLSPALRQAFAEEGFDGNLGLTLEAIGDVGVVAMTDHTPTTAKDCRGGAIGARLELYPTVRSTLLGKELITRPSDTSAVLAMWSLVDLEVVVDVKPRGAEKTPWAHTARKVFPAGTPIHVPITGLKPDTAYRVRARYRRPGIDTWEKGPDRRLQTRRSPGASFTVDLTSDGHLLKMQRRRKFRWMRMYRQTMMNVAEDDADLLFDLGDTLGGESYKGFDAPDHAEALRRAADVRPYFETADTPTLLVLGNHEGEQGWRLDGTENNLTVRAGRVRKALYPNPVPGGIYSGNTAKEPFVGAPENYYAFVWGDAQFIVLDPYRYTTTKPHAFGGTPCSEDRWDWTLGETQYRWLQRTLEASDARYIFVMAHQVTGGVNSYGRGGRLAAVHDPSRRARGSYEWGGIDHDGTPLFDEKRPGWGRPVHKLMADHHVTAFFHGHDHAFVLEPPVDGVTYVTVPQPGQASARTGHARRGRYDPELGEVVANSGHIRIKVTPASATLDYVRAWLPQQGANREVAATTTWDPRPRRPAPASTR